MRKDMNKVIVERPRKGGVRESSNRRQKELLDDWENSPSRESMKFRHRGNRKSLNENLAPLKRFLLKAVGRSWNKVYSEICENINVTNTVQNHIRQHVPDFVALHVTLINKKPHDPRYGHIIWHPMYVHPVTGILCKTPKKARTKYKQKPTFEQIAIDKYHKYVKVEDLWYFVTFKDIPDNEWTKLGLFPTDVIFKKRSANRIQEWGAHIYASSKRSVNKKELKQIQAEKGFK